MSAKTHFKLQFNKDTRRVRRNKITGKDYAEIEELVKSLFKVESFVLKYKDDEGDFVFLSSDMELEEAFEFADAEGIALKLMVTSPPNRNESPFVVVGKEEKKAVKVSAKTQASEEAPKVITPQKVGKNNQQHDVSVTSGNHYSNEVETENKHTLDDTSQDDRKITGNKRCNAEKKGKSASGGSETTEKKTKNGCNRREKNKHGQKWRKCFRKEYKKEQEEKKSSRMDAAKAFLSNDENVKAIQACVPVVVKAVLEGKSPVQIIDTVLEDQPGLKEDPFVAKSLPCIRGVAASISPEMITHLLFVVLPGIANIFCDNNQAGGKCPPLFRILKKFMRSGPGFHSGNEVHFGFVCDVTGMAPIIGPRFHKRGENYDLCESAFNELCAEEKKKYDRIEPPAANPMGRMFGGGFFGGSPFGGFGSGWNNSSNPPFSSWGRGRGNNWRHRHGHGHHHGRHHGHGHHEPSPPNQQASRGDVTLESLKLLSEMGFTDTEKNVALLQKHGGHMQAVVSELTGQRQ